MFDKLRSIAIFARVVDRGSFREAARSLGLAPSRISEIVSALEKDLGVTLLYRSTRQLSMTHEGRLLYDKAREMIGAAESGLDAINPTTAEPTGSLRVAAPAFVTQTELMVSFAKFARAYPKIKTDFDFSDQTADLIRDGYDVAIRAGWLEDSAFLARTLGHIDRLLVASPDYLSAQPTPSHPRDLESWNWIRFAIRSNYTDLSNQSGEVVSVTGKSHVTVNSADALYEFAVRGLGLSAIPRHLANRGFERGELVQVLPSWQLRPLGVHAVWPDGSRRENVTTLFVRFLAKELA